MQLVERRYVNESTEIFLIFILITKGLGLKLQRKLSTVSNLGHKLSTLGDHRRLSCALGSARSDSTSVRHVYNYVHES